MSQPLRVDEFLQQLRKYENKEDFLSLMKIYEQKYYDQFESQANSNFPPELQRQSLSKQNPTYENNKMPYQTYQKPPVQRSMSANKLEINEPQFTVFQRPSPRQELPIDPFAPQNAYNDPSRQQFLNNQQFNQQPQLFPSKPSPQPIFPQQPQFHQSIQKQEPIYQNQFQPQQPQYQNQLNAQQFPQTVPQYSQQKQFLAQGQFQPVPQFQSQPQQQQYTPHQLFQQNQQLQQQQQQQLHQLTPGPQFIQGNIDQLQPQYSQQNKQQQMEAFLNEIKAQRLMKQQQYK